MCPASGGSLVADPNPGGRPCLSLHRVKGEEPILGGQLRTRGHIWSWLFISPLQICEGVSLDTYGYRAYVVAWEPREVSGV